MQEGGDPIMHMEEVSMLIERTEERLPSGALASILALHHSFASSSTPSFIFNSPPKAP